MSRDKRETHDSRHDEPTLAHDLRVKCPRQPLFLEFPPARGAEPLERTVW